MPPAKKSAKLTEAEELEFAKLAERAAKLLAALFGVGKKRIIGKRQGDEALIIRRVLFRWLKGRECPMKLMARIFGLDRCAPGADAEAMELWEARNPELDAQMEAIADGLDQLLTVRPKRFVSMCMTEIEADRAALAAQKTAREAADLLERNDPSPKKKFSPEVEAIVARGQKDRAKAKIEQEIKNHMAVIREGTKEGASKEAKRDAIKARDAIEAITRDAKKKRKAKAARS